MNKSKKYGLIWECHEEEILNKMKKYASILFEDKEKRIFTKKNLPTNYLIEGDNLHSLYLLKKSFKHKVDVIYIDPPYNTGAKGWKYCNNYVDKNDFFKHSKWLSMMSVRMKIAIGLLKDDGVFICSIDENELGALLLLIEDIFGDDYTTDIITIVHNPRGVQGDNFSYVNEYAIFVYRKGYKVIGERIVEEDEIDWTPLRNWGSESKRSDARNCFYPIYVKDGVIVGFGDVTPNDIHPKQTEYDEKTDTYAVYPIDVKGVERKWRYARQTVENIWHLLRAKQTKKGLDIELGKNYASYKTVWIDKKYDANEYGTQLLNSMVPNNEFPFPKSVYTVYECLYTVLINRKDAIILDYFAGSGTTGHAVLMLNKNTNNQHRFILCTNNDVGKSHEKEFLKNHDIIDYDSKEWKEWENKYGIASSVTYKRMEAVINGFVHTKDFKNVLFQKKITITTLKNTDKIFTEIEKIINENDKKYDEVKTKIDGDTIIVLGIKKRGNKIDGIPANLVYLKTNFIKPDEVI